MDKKEKPFVGASWPTLFGVAVCVVLIVSMVVLMALVKTPTQLENALMTFILTAASSVTSYLVSKMFAEQAFTQTLRDHGVQIARGIIELKAQIGTLADWITGKREVLSRTGKLNESSESALEHVEVTLNGFRGLADNAVGGIAGVIGDAYAQYEDFIGQIERIRTDAQVKTSEIEEEMERAQEMETSPAQTDLRPFQKRIDEIANQTERKISQLAKHLALPLPPPAAKRSFTVNCPNELCAAPNSFEMLDRHGETKSLICKKCGKPFNAHFSVARGVFSRIGAGAVTHPTALVPHPVVQKLPDWAMPNAIADEARFILQRTQAFVEPGQIGVLIQSVLLHDSRLKQANHIHSAYDLQARVLSDPDKTIPGVAVRNFFKLVFMGGGFQTQPNTPSLFRSPYTNALSKETLLDAYTAGAVVRLANLRPVNTTVTAELARALFDGDGPAREELVKTVIERHHEQRG